MKEAEKLASLLEPVEMVPLNTILTGDFGTLSRNSHAIVVGKGKNRTIVNHCSENYYLVPNKEIVESMEKALEGVDYRIEYRVKNRSKFYIDFIVNAATAAITKGDVVNLRVTFNNSYDGRVKLHYHYGVYRLVCTNGLALPAESAVGRKLMHTPQILDYQVIEGISDSVQSLTGDFKKLIKPYQEMAKKKVGITKQEDLVSHLEELILDTKYPKRALDEAADRILSEATKLNTPVNNWLIYNGLNFALFSPDNSTMDEHKKTRIDEHLLESLS